MRYGNFRRIGFFCNHTCKKKFVKSHQAMDNDLTLLVLPLFLMLIFNIQYVLIVFHELFRQLEFQAI